MILVENRFISPCCWFFSFSSTYSTSTLTKQDKACEAKSLPYTSHSTQPSSLEKPKVHQSVLDKNVHNYDAVPDEQNHQLEMKENHRSSASRDLRPNSMTTSMLFTKVYRSPVCTNKISKIDAKLRTKSISELGSSDTAMESEYMCTREWRHHFGHDPDRMQITNEHVTDLKPAKIQVTIPSDMTNSSVQVNTKSHLSLPANSVVVTTKMIHGSYYEGDLSIRNLRSGICVAEPEKVSIE